MQLQHCTPGQKDTSNTRVACTPGAAGGRDCYLDGVLGLQVVGVGVGADQQHARGVAVQLGQVAAVAPAHVLRAVAVQPVRDVAVGVQAVQDGVRIPAGTPPAVC